MNHDGLETKLRELGKIISDKMGIHFADRRLPDLRRGIERAAKELGHRDLLSCLSWLLTTPITKETVKILAAHLTIGETYFLRDEKLFKAMEQRILPDRIKDALGTNKVIRIWCAGCSTGEEPYSLAILLTSILRDISKWHITILGTDINAESLRRAEEGVYSEWSFRGTPDWWRTRYFVKERDGRYRLINDIKKLVTFSYHNLVEDPFPSLTNNTNAMHIVLCRNVLMYFNPSVRRDVVHHLQTSLVDRGWFIASPAETAIIDHPGLRKVTVFGTLVYQKIAAPAYRLDHMSSHACMFTKNPSGSAQPLERSTSDITPSHPYFSNDMPDEVASVSGKSHQAMVSPTLSLEEAQRLYLEGRYEELVNNIVCRAEAPSRKETHDTNTLALLSRAFANTGRLEEAERWCREAIKKDKSNPSHHFLLATILQELGANKEAAQALKIAVYLDQDFIPAHFALANLEKRYGSLETSRKHFRNILKLLEKFDAEKPIPELDGITAGRMREIVRAISEEYQPLEKERVERSS